MPRGGGGVRRRRPFQCRPTSSSALSSRGGPRVRGGGGQSLAEAQGGACKAVPAARRSWNGPAKPAGAPAREPRFASDGDGGAARTRNGRIPNASRGASAGEGRRASRVRHACVHEHGDGQFRIKRPGGLGGVAAVTTALNNCRPTRAQGGARWQRCVGVNKIKRMSQCRQVVGGAAGHGQIDWVTAAH